MHIAPILLGAGTRLFDNPEGEPPIRLALLNEDEPTLEVNLRYRLARATPDASG